MEKGTSVRRDVAAKPSPHAPQDGEHVRVVPLHQPKPRVSIEEMSKRAHEPDESELFDGTPHAAPTSALLTYRGGALIQNVEVFTIFWGTKWDSPAGDDVRSKLNKFFDKIVASPLMDQLAEYSVPGRTIGRGSHVGTTTITANAPTKSVADSSVRKHLKIWVKSGAVPTNGPNTLYFVFLDPGVVAFMGGSKSCQSFCGYHDATGDVYYAVMPYPTCAGCLGGMSAFDALTGTSSHELCEAVTDPVPGKGWYDDDNGEIGDICAWNFKKVAGYTVQLEWSNKKKKCV